MRERQKIPATAKVAIGSFAAAAGFALTATLLLLLASGPSLFPGGGSMENIAMTSQTEEMSSDPDQNSSSSDIQAATESSVGPTEPYLVGIIPSPRIVNVEEIGSSQQISVQGMYSDGTIYPLQSSGDALLTFSSTDPEVAVVDSSGLLTGMKFGGADIEVGYKDYSVTVPALIWGPVRRIPPIDEGSLVTSDRNGLVTIVNRILIELKPGHGIDVAQEVASTIDGEVVFEFNSFLGFVVEFDGQSVDDLTSALDTVSRDERVLQAYSDGLVEHTQRPNPTSVIENIDFPTPANYTDPFQSAGLMKTWKYLNLITSGNPPLISVDPVVLVVIDSDFAIPPTGNTAVDSVLSTEFGNIRAVKSISDTYPLGDKRVYVRDLVSGESHSQHGVAVTSVMVAENNNRIIEPNVTSESFSGVVSSVNSLDYMVIFYGIGFTGANNPKIDVRKLTTAFDQINALEHILPMRYQVDVVNMSFGSGKCPVYTGFLGTVESEEDCHLANPFVQKLMKLMNSMPRITFVAGAGNSSINLHDPTNPPSPVPIPAGPGPTPTASVYVPAQLTSSIPNLITVGNISVTPNLKWETSSSYGESVTIVAPGVSIPVVDVNNGGYGRLTGTSFAAPIVSGTVALIRSIRPDWHAPQIKDLLLRNANRSHQLCRDRTESNPCPTSGLIPALDASTAIWELIRSRVISLNAEFVPGSFDFVVRRHRPVREVELFIKIKNTSSREWTFYVDGVVRGGILANSLDLKKIAIPANGSQEINFTIRNHDHGAAPWTVRFDLYRDSYRVSHITEMNRPFDVPPIPALSAPPLLHDPSTLEPFASPKPTPTPTVTPTPLPTHTRTLTPTPTATPVTVPTPTAAPGPTSVPAPTASPTQVPTATPAPVPTTTPVPTQTPTPPPPRVPAPPPGLTELEYQLLRDVYACGQQSTVIKLTVISLEFFANLTGYQTLITKEIMEDWDLFLPAFTELLRADSEAAEMLSELLDLFCRQN